MLCPAAAHPLKLLPPVQNKTSIECRKTKHRQEFTNKILSAMCSVHSQNLFSAILGSSTSFEAPSAYAGINNKWKLVHHKQQVTQEIWSCQCAQCTAKNSCLARCQAAANPLKLLVSMPHHTLGEYAGSRQILWALLHSKGECRTLCQRAAHAWGLFSSAYTWSAEGNTTNSTPQKVHICCATFCWGAQYTAKGQCTVLCQAAASISQLLC